ncbi:hypothetical protein [Sphingomonas melonis]|jgi:hypothetical protein
MFGPGVRTIGDRFLVCQQTQPVGPEAEQPNEGVMDEVEGVMALGMQLARSH